MSNQTEPSIVERLRHSAAVNRAGGYDGDAEEREEAAKEIERLTHERDESDRASVANYNLYQRAKAGRDQTEQLSLESALNRIGELHGEIERLRKALKWYSENSGVPGVANDTLSGICWLCEKPLPCGCEPLDHECELLIGKP